MCDDFNSEKFKRCFLFLSQRKKRIGGLRYNMKGFCRVC